MDRISLLMYFKNIVFDNVKCKHLKVIFKKSSNVMPNMLILCNIQLQC